MLHALLLLAEAPDQTTGGQPGGNALIQMIMIVGMIMIFFFFFVRGPAKKREQEQQALLGDLKKNDEVLTSAGIIGLVANISETQDEVTLKLDESSNTRIRVLKSTIVRNYTREKQRKEQKEAK
jgi:preprotein translocase subunit YajC